MQIQPKAATMQHCATLWLPAMCRPLPISAGQTKFCPKLEGVNHKWPTAAQRCSANAVFQEVPRKPDINNSNKWRHVQELKVIRVIKKKYIRHKCLRKICLWSSEDLDSCILSTSAWTCLGRSPLNLCDKLLSSTLRKKCSYGMCLRSAGPAIFILAVS